MATEGREQLIHSELGGDLDAKGYKIINADLSESINLDVDIPTIETTDFVLKGDGVGNAEVATENVDYWGTDVFVASGDDHAIGLVPDPGASAGTAKFLREDATWVAPPGTLDVPTIASTTVVLKGDNAGNAVAATAKTDFWDTTNFVGSGVGHAKGLVPDPGASAASDAFLCEDGTWAVPPASAGVTIESTSAVIKGDGAGGGIAAVAGTDFVAPSTALTRLLAGTTALSGTTPAINWNTTTTFSWTLSGNSTPTFSNATDGYDVIIGVTNTASNYTVTWPAAVIWSGGTQPTQTVGAVKDLWGFKQIGSTIYGAVVQNMT